MAVKSRKERSYREAVRALGKLGDERAIPVLQEVANTDPEEWVRKAAEDSISSIRAANKPQG
jgi:HEAT repeat protein